jgi:hypothetical protein
MLLSPPACPRCGPKGQEHRGTTAMAGLRRVCRDKHTLSSWLAEFFTAASARNSKREDCLRSTRVHKRVRIQIRLRHPVTDLGPRLEVSAVLRCLANEHQRYQSLRSRLYKMGLHGLYLDVIIGVCCISRPRRNLVLKCSHSAAITVNLVIVPMAVPRLPLRSLSPQ